MALKQNKEALVKRKKTTKSEIESKNIHPEDSSERQILHEPLLTVDQLSAYRKKPGAALPVDNLVLPEGSLKHLRSEYQRRFKKYDLAPITHRKPRTITPLKPEGQHEFHTEYERSFAQVSESFYRPQLIRRCTNLKLEGNYYHLTDYRENFTAFLLQKKNQLQRTATTLKLLGEMNLDTENRRNFVLYQNVFRPPLCKKLTNLHLSGSLHMDTENRDKFLRYTVEKQHPLRKMPTNLHLEGTFFLQPEYTSAFVEYKNFEKTKPLLPVDHLKSPIDIIINSDSSETLKHPFIPNLRSYLYSHPDVPKKSTLRPLSGSISRPPSRNSDRYLDVRVEQSPRRDKRVYGSPETVVVRSIEPKINIPQSAEKSSRSRWSSRGRTHQSASLKAESPSYFGEEQKTRSIAKSLPTLHRSNWRSKSRTRSRDVYHVDSPSSPEYDGGRFECQPEYRKAYLNYIMRERIGDKPAVERNNSGNKQTTTKGDGSGYLSPTKQLRTRKSSPNLYKQPQRGLELIEKEAFGRRCRHVSTSEISSSDEVLSSRSKKSQIPRSIQIHTSKKHLDSQNEESESEPAFLVM